MATTFETWPPLLNALAFVMLATGVWVAGTRLSYLIDAIAERTRITHGMAGLLFLATATELPEMVTSITAASSGNAALALNNMFGGIAMQTAVLAIADMFIINRALTSLCKTPVPILQGVCLITGLGILSVGYHTGDTPVLFHIGGISILVAFLYVASIVLIQRFSNAETWHPVDLPDTSTDTVKNKRHRDASLHSLSLSAVCMAGAILLCGVPLTWVSEALATQTGLGDSFVGATLLAATTSLPELSASIAAVRMGVPIMAISNIFGSNMIMILLLLPTDAFYLPGAILNEIDASAAMALSTGIIITAVYCIGLLVRPQKVFFGRMGVDSAAVILVYISSIYGLYVFR